jgi:hypothetical protein
MSEIKSATIAERVTIPHAAFEHAVQRIEHCFSFAVHKAEAEGVAIVGESRTGKTRALKSFLDRQKPTRKPDGMEIPVLFATVPSLPSVKSLAGVMLEALQAPDPYRGTENEKSRCIRRLMRGDLDKDGHDRRIPAFLGSWNSQGHASRGGLVEDSDR